MTLEELKAENARLKAEVENSNRINTELLLLSNKQASEVRRLTAELSNISGWGRGLESDLSHARVEISFLKAEVERLRASSFVTAVPVEEYEKLKAEVERLRKAGDGLYKSMLEIGCNEMADNFQYDDWWGSMRAWQSAKEGKQP